MVKEVLYAENFGKVLLETIKLVVNPDYYDKGFRSALLEIAITACRQFHKNASSELGDDRITLMNIDHQTPRLLLMPLLEEIVKEHLRFTYAFSIGKYVSLGFFYGGKSLYGKPGEEGVIQAGLSYVDVEALLQNNNHTSFLALPEYWKVYHEMEKRGQNFALRSLQHDRYVELLDTLILEGRMIKSGSRPIQEVHNT